MEIAIEIISVAGLILFLIGVFNRSKPLGQKFMIIGGFCMATPILYEVYTGFYDGMTNSPRKD
jgi:hypothetical membrane protein